MPKDHSKQGYRGIGFVTFASPDSVEKVMAVKHWMNGHEIAIDRATPKEEPTALKNIFARLPVGPNQRRSFDNGEGLRVRLPRRWPALSTLAFTVPVVAAWRAVSPLRKGLMMNAHTSSAPLSPAARSPGLTASPPPTLPTSIQARASSGPA